VDDVKRRTVSTLSSSSPAEHSRRRLCDGLDELDGAEVAVIVIRQNFEKWLSAGCVYDCSRFGMAGAGQNSIWVRSE